MALTKYQLIAKSGSEQNKTGRFFNLVTCFTPVKVVIKQGGRELLSTTASAGMSFEFKSGFDSIEFYSDVTQAIEYWASETKLTYEPKQVGQVGASFLGTKLTGAKGAGSNILVPANSMRRRVMLESVEGSVFIGGAYVTNADGWELKIGERIELDVAGDVWSWWTNESHIKLFDWNGNIENGQVINGLAALPYYSTVVSVDEVNTATPGKQILFNTQDGLKANIILTRSLIDTATYFDVTLQPEDEFLKFETIGIATDNGGGSGSVSINVAISVGDIDDYSGRALQGGYESATSGDSGAAISKEIYLYVGKSDEIRTKRVWVWNNHSDNVMLAELFVNSAPVRLIKVAELIN
ncbi:hypothetical protein [Shewanella algae]|uniref:hypothetical protein n=1 Tax=Shewanella algae TaxID=38313 RepID=UPI0031F4B399